jgi:hypothetical protein
MDNVEFVLDGIMKFRSLNYSEGLSNDEITLSGSQKSFFGGNDYTLIIKKSTHSNDAANVSFSKNSIKKSIDIPRKLLIDILNTNKLLDVKLQWKLDVVFGEKKIQIIDGKVVIK